MSANKMFLLLTDWMTILLKYELVYTEINITYFHSTIHKKVFQLVIENILLNKLVTLFYPNYKI